MAAWDPAFDVVALVRQPPIETIEGVRYLDVKDSSDALWDSQPWTVVNAATHYGRGNRAAEKTLESNLIFPLRVLERAGPKVQHFVTLDTYYNKFEMPYAYLPEYCRSKRNLFEWLLTRIETTHITRVFLEHVYGPGDREDKFVPNLLNLLAKNMPIDLTKGLQTRDFIFVDDASAAILQIARELQDETPGSSDFQVGTGNAVSIRNIAELARDITESSSELRFGSLPDRIGEIENSYADTSKLTDLGWKAETSLLEGLAQTAAKMIKD